MGICHDLNSSNTFHLKMSKYEHGEYQDYVHTVQVVKRNVVKTDLVQEQVLRCVAGITSFQI